MIRIGYACINTKLDAPNRTCRLKNATPEKILELAAANVEALQPILDWHAAQGIELFRITSDLIPIRPGAHVVEIAYAGHVHFFEQPDAFSVVMLGFLQKHASW